MSIKQNGGVFGRNPTFNDVTIEGDLIINGEVFTGLDFQGSWNASTNTPALASSTGTNGEFYIVSVAGTTDLNGITNWGIGDWAIFNGTAWQRVEGGADGNFNDLTANSLTVNGTATMDGLTVDGNVTFNTNTLKISDNIPKLVFEDTDTSTLASIIANSSNITYDTVATSKDHIFKQGGTTRMVIDDTGIDVTGELDVTNTAARAAYIRSTTTGSRMHFLDATTTSVTTVGVGAEGNNIVLHGGGAEVLRGLSSGDVSIPNGNLGIGVSANYSLDVAGSAGGTLARFKDSDSSHNGIIIAGDTNAGWVGNSSSNTGEGIYYQNSSNRMRVYTGGQEAMILDSSQNVSIPNGTITSAGKDVGTQTVTATAPTSATGFPNGHVWYVV